MSALPSFYAVLANKAQVQVVTENVSDNQVRVMFRVPKKSSSWVKLVHNILIAARSANLAVDISRQYFLLKDDPHDMRYGYRFILQAKPTEHIDKLLAQSVGSAKTAAKQLEEVPLIGSPTRCKNSGPLGSVKVGKAALQ